jgi:peptidoglycan/xylan/chitin deacetylase (PgdA/CDA1 family)
LATALLLTAIGCSDSKDDPVGAAGMGGTQSASTGGTAGTAAGGTAGTAAGGTAGTAAGGAATGGTGTGGTATGAGGTEAFPEPDKLVALSFDDGPSPERTPAILDKLEAHQVSATFFLIGQNINAGAQAVLDRAKSLGCTFGNHSAGYAALTAQTPEAINTSIDSTNAAILQFTGTEATFFRPPNLAVDDNLYATVDMPFAGGLVGGDFPAQFGGMPTQEAVTNTILNGVQDGTIILLHDNQPDLDPQPTPPALDTIIPELKRRGYEIVTLEELFERRGVDPNSGGNVLWMTVPPS